LLDWVDVVTGVSGRTDRPLYGLFGPGGFGRPVMPILIENVRSRHGGDADIVFVQDEPVSTQINGVKIMGTEAFLTESRKTVYFNVALADSHARKAVCERFLAVGHQPVSIISSQANILGPAEIGVGAIICGFCTITTNVRIGDFFHANIYSYVEHDSVIGDYVTFAPRVGCNGNIAIRDMAYIGAGAVIRQGDASGPVVIGHGATVGMGAVVLNSVPDGDTVAGNPARSIRGSGRVSG
jgi:sugar O-acyltransferase (sialic acid O-acetyltransferase NeuD family)